MRNIPNSIAIILAIFAGFCILVAFKYSAEYNVPMIIYAFGCAMSLFITAGLFASLGSILTELRNMRESIAKQPQDRSWEVAGTDKASGFDTIVYVNADNEAQARVNALAKGLSRVTHITKLPA